jgi:hypothetical protein
MLGKHADYRRWAVQETLEAPGGQKKISVPGVRRPRGFQTRDYLGQLSKVREEKLRLRKARALGS